MEPLLFPEVEIGRLTLGEAFGGAGSIQGSAWMQVDEHEAEGVDPLSFSTFFLRM